MSTRIIIPRGVPPVKECEDGAHGLFRDHLADLGIVPPGPEVRVSWHACPWCQGAGSLRVKWDRRRWACFACGRGGGLRHLMDEAHKLWKAEAEARRRQEERLRAGWIHARTTAWQAANRSLDPQQRYGQSAERDRLVKQALQTLANTGPEWASADPLAEAASRLLEDYSRCLVDAQYREHWHDCAPGVRTVQPVPEPCRKFGHETCVWPSQHKKLTDKGPDGERVSTAERAALWYYAWRESEFEPLPEAPPEETMYEVSPNGEVRKVPPDDWSEWQTTPASQVVEAIPIPLAIVVLRTPADPRQARALARRFMRREELADVFTGTYGFLGAAPSPGGGVLTEIRILARLEPVTLREVEDGLILPTVADPGDLEWSDPRRNREARALAERLAPAWRRLAGPGAEVEVRPVAPEFQALDVLTELACRAEQDILVLIGSGQVNPEAGRDWLKQVYAPEGATWRSAHRALEGPGWRVRIPPGLATISPMVLTPAGIGEIDGEPCRLCRDPECRQHPVGGLISWRKVAEMEETGELVLLKAFRAPSGHVLPVYLTAARPRAGPRLRRRRG
ncbi:MAG: hypothetical protein QME87_05620 [Bacillota bacterium]|nr:hypothetical protein [Bacillota bacterium]